METYTEKSDQNWQPKHLLIYLSVKSDTFSQMGKVNIFS